MSDQKYRPLLIRLPPDIDDALRSYCSENERALSWAVCKAVDEWLHRQHSPILTELVCRAEDAANLISGITGMKRDTALSSLPAAIDLFYAQRINNA